MNSTDRPAASGYAAALAELDEILGQLERSDVDVDVLATQVQRAAELIEFCRERLPVFKAPNRIHFRKSLPISAANKILKRDLKTEYANADKGG